ncbi:MAG TPA: LysE family transporter [Candidatus Sulfotelmatobacter sp.]|nr:LysE family transporter [Candidatus Sulfotelmatobacter sp.]
MLTSAIAGGLAGFGIAIPVGAIAVLLIATAASRGLAVGLAAGAGVASADGIYATLAAVFGAALSTVVTPWLGDLRVVAAIVLAAIGLGGLWRLRRRATPAADRAAANGQPAGARGTYARFLGLTLLNPVTVIYFAALMVAVPATGAAPAERLAFAAGAFAASLAWQSLLAVVGAILHRRASVASRSLLSAGGYLIVLAFAARIGAQAILG